MNKDIESLTNAREFIKNKLIILKQLCISNLSFKIKLIACLTVFNIKYYSSLIELLV